MEYVKGRIPYEQLGGKAKLLADAFDMKELQRKEKGFMIQGDLFEEAGETVEKLQQQLKEGITFIDYKFVRKNNYLILDKELTVQQLRMKEGDVLDVKLSDTNQVFFAIRKPAHVI